MTDNFNVQANGHKKKQPFDEELLMIYKYQDQYVITPGSSLA